MTLQDFQEKYRSEVIGILVECWSHSITDTPLNFQGRGKKFTKQYQMADKLIEKMYHDIRGTHEQNGKQTEKPLQQRTQSHGQDRAATRDAGPRSTT